MEEFFNKAENAKSLSGETYKWIWFFVVTIWALIIVWPKLDVSENEANFIEFFTCIGGAAAIAALGNNLTKNKRRAELTSLISAIY